MTTRVLPPEEWPKLAGTEAETVWPHIPPDAAEIIVVEDDGQIVGCHILVTVLHAECLWIHPEKRGRSSVARRLWARVCEAARAKGAHHLMTGCADARVRGLLDHVGATKMPCDQYLVSVE